MATVRCCPHCKKKIPLDEGYTFDKNLNMICCSCGKVILGTARSTDSQVTTLAVGQKWPLAHHQQIPGCD